MWTTLVEYHRPKTIPKCLELLAREYPHTVPLAGGTWLIPHHPPQIDAVVDLSALNLEFIKSSAHDLKIGAITTLQTIIDTPSSKNFASDLLREASYKNASRTTRNVATLGGSIVTGSSTSELCQALLVLNAQVVIFAPKKIKVPISDFFTNRVAHLKPASIITEVIIPKDAGYIGAGSVQVSRTPQAQPIVNASALISKFGHVCSLVRLALGGVTDYPIRLLKIEALITHQNVDATFYDRVTEAVKRETFQYPLSEYQREMAGIVVARAFQKAWEQAEKE